MEVLSLDCLNQLEKMVIEGRPYLVETLVKEILKNDVPVYTILEILSNAMERIGQYFEEKKYCVADVWFSAKAFDKAKEIIEPLIPKISTKGKILLGTVEGDVHSIGTKIVQLFLEGDGFEVINLGVDVSYQMFIDGYMEHNPQIIGLAAWLDTTANISLKEAVLQLIEYREKNNLDFKIIVGGLAVSPRFAKAIGADSYAKNAREAVYVANDLLNNSYDRLKGMMVEEAWES